MSSLKCNWQLGEKCQYLLVVDFASLTPLAWIWFPIPISSAKPNVSRHLPRDAFFTGQFVLSYYKYLGIWFNNSGSFNFAQNELVRKPFKLKSDFLVHNPEVKTSIHVFDHTIKPILLYGCEILGYFTVYLMVQKWKHSNRPNFF